jgi:hypothetical protein
MKAVLPSRCRAIYASTASAVCLRRPSARIAAHLGQPHAVCSEPVTAGRGANRGWFSLLQIALVLCLLFCVTAAGQQNIADRVLKLQRHGIGLHGLETRSGTGWCADAGCSLLATNYHVAKEGLPRKIGGAKVVGFYLASGPTDYGAAWIMTTYGKWARYNPLRDVALVSLSHPLLPGKRALPFHVGNLMPGQDLVVNGVPAGGKQAAVAAKFLHIVDGLLELSLPHEAPAGLSGSMVTDKQGRIVGMLSSVTEGSAFAVPVWSIADAIRKFRPALYGQMFPDGVPTPPGFQGPTVFSRELLAALAGASPEPVVPVDYLEDRLGQPFPMLIAPPVRLMTTRQESADIQKLRRRAQGMFKQMANFKALQRLRLNTEGRSELTLLHELYVDSGDLLFRPLDDGQPLQVIPFPHRRRAVVPGAEWHELPQMVATQFGLCIQEVGEKEVGGKRLRVFAYQASIEDRVCWVRFRNSEVFRSRDRQFPVACRGEVWTDDELNVLRISQELELTRDKVPMQLLQLAVLYGWLGHDLVPVAMVVRGSVEGHNCRADADFSNYRRIDSR